MSTTPSPLEVIGSHLKDKNAPFTLLVDGKLSPEKVTYFEAFAKEAVRGTRLEPGNVAYEYHQSLENPGHVIVFERWKNFAALEYHFSLEHTKKVMQAFDSCSLAPLHVEVFQVLAD